LSKTS